MPKSAVHVPRRSRRRRSPREDASQLMGRLTGAVRRRTGAVKSRSPEGARRWRAGAREAAAQTISRARKRVTTSANRWRR